MLCRLAPGLGAEKKPSTSTNVIRRRNGRKKLQRRSDWHKATILIPATRSLSPVILSISRAPRCVEKSSLSFLLHMLTHVIRTLIGISGENSFSSIFLETGEMEKKSKEDYTRSDVARPSVSFSMSSRSQARQDRLILFTPRALKVTRIVSRLKSEREKLSDHRRVCCAKRES